MNITLNKDLENYLRNLISTGEYVSESEIMKDALELHRAYMDKRDLQDRLEIASREAADGHAVAADDAFFDELKMRVSSRTLR